MRDRGRDAACADARGPRPLCARAHADAAPPGGAPARSHDGAAAMTAMDPRVAEAFARLPDYLGSHVLVSMTALALGVALSLPVALMSIRRPGLRAGVVALASILPTISGPALP